MQDDLSAIIEDFELAEVARQELDEMGFTIPPGPVDAEALGHLSAAYDSVMATAVPDDVKIGSSTTRVRDFVNRDAVLDGLYLHPPVLKACCHVIKEPFRLSTMHARTLWPSMPAQDLHVDVERDSPCRTIVSFIFMVEEFRKDNGATRFIPGSHRWPAVPPDSGVGADDPGQVVACGPAGSMIVFNGSIWHGHTMNRSGRPRRSIQGAYIRRDATPGENLAARMLPETLSRISPLAKYLIGVPGASIL